MRLTALFCCLIPAALLVTACDRAPETPTETTPVEELRVYPVESVRAVDVVGAMRLIASREAPTYSVSQVDDETIMVRADPAIHATIERVLDDLDQLRGSKEVDHESPMMVRYWVVTMRPTNGDHAADPLLAPVRESLASIYPAYSFEVEDHLEVLLDPGSREPSTLKSPRGTMITHSIDSRNSKLVLKSSLEIDPVAEDGAQQSHTNFQAPVQVGQPIVIQRSMIEDEESTDAENAYQLVVVRVDPAPESG